MPISIYLYGAHTLRFLYTDKIVFVSQISEFFRKGIPEAKRLQVQGLSLLIKRTLLFFFFISLELERSYYLYN